MKSGVKEIEITQVSDTTLCVTFLGSISISTNQNVLTLANLLRQHPEFKQCEISTAYTSLAIKFRGPILGFTIQQINEAKALIYNALNDLNGEEQEILPPPKIQEIPVCYDLEFGVDLPDLSTRFGLSVEEIIQRHTAMTYHVFMIGFMPGFPYMGMVDELLEAPRRITPRVKVQAGSVAIAGRQTGIYPFATPGGWNILGRTPLQLFNHTQSMPSLLKAGDKVKLVSISKKEFNAYGT